MSDKIFNSKLLVFLIVFLFVQPKLYAAPIDDWQKLIQEGSSYKFDGQYNLAIQSFTKALNIAESEKLFPKCLPISLCRLASVEVITHQVDAADSHFKKNCWNNQTTKRSKYS